MKKAQRIMARLPARAVAGRLGVTAFLCSGLALTVAGARADSGSQVLMPGRSVMPR